MKNCWAKLLSVLIISGLLWMTSESVDFCQSFEDNGHEMIVFSDVDSKDVLLIVGMNYWQMKQNNGQLQVANGEELVINSTEDCPKQWQYSYSIGAFVDTPPNVGFHSAFYNAQNKSFDVLEYKNKVFKFIACNVKLNQLELYSNITMGFNFPSSKNAVLVAQVLDPEMGIYSRSFLHKAIKANMKDMSILEMDQVDVTHIMNKLANISADYKMIGLFMNNSDVYVMVRDIDFIYYCILDECSEDRIGHSLKVLIDCSLGTETMVNTAVDTGTEDTDTDTDTSSKNETSIKTTLGPKSSSSIIGYIIIIVMLLVLLCIFGLIFYCFRYYKKEISQKSTESSAIETVDSKSDSKIEYKRTNENESGESGETD